MAIGDPQSIKSIYPLCSALWIRAVSCMYDRFRLEAGTVYGKEGQCLVAQSKTRPLFDLLHYITITRQ